MPDPDPLLSTEQADPLASWRVAPGPAPPPSDDAPTVRTGSSKRQAGSSLSGRSSPRSLPMPQPGEQLGSFILEEPIGIGGMGAVFLATDTRLRRQVALKILPPEQAEDPENVQRFYQEGQSAAQLDHENIARIYTIGADRGYHFIAFEYIEGTTIRQKVERDGVLSVAETINYTLQIANALVHATERGVVHRDIKPSNIIVTAQGRAKLVDMGLARRFERGATDDGLTQSGMTLGTFDYISPEQARDPRNVDVRSDLYSLGCTLFHMLTGQPPFPEGTVLQKLLQHQEDPAPDVRTFNPAVPTDLAAIILKLMEKDRERRYQSPEQLVRDLLAVAGALGLRSISPEGLVWMSNAPSASWERHLVWGLPTIALAILVSALLWWGQVPGSAPVNPILNPAGPPPLTTEPDPSTVVGPPRIMIAPKEPAPSAQPDRQGPDASKTDRSMAQAARQWLVGSDEDLGLAIAKAPADATLILTDNGPYYLSPMAIGRLDPSGSAAGRDLVIKADAGVHPLLLASHDSVEDGVDEAALLAFQGGRVRLEGITFQLDATSAIRRLSAISAEDVDLSLTRCHFRREGPQLGNANLIALSLRSTARDDLDDARPLPTRLVSCHLDGGQVGIRARGRVELHLRDCTLGAGEPSFWIDNGEEIRGAVPADLTLQDVRILADSTPVFQFSKTTASLLVSDSVIAASTSDQPATLVATDTPDWVDWFGRGNLYGGIGTFLQPTGDRPDQSPTRSFAAWSEDQVVIRESRSESVSGSVWALEDPASQLAQDDDPSAAFQLAARTLEVWDRERGSELADEPFRPRLRPGGVIANLLDSALLQRRPADEVHGSSPAEDDEFLADAPAPNDEPGQSATDAPSMPKDSELSDDHETGALATSATDDRSDRDPMGSSASFSEMDTPMSSPAAGPMSIGPPSPMPVSPSEEFDPTDSAFEEPSPPSDSRSEAGDPSDMTSESRRPSLAERSSSTTIEAPQDDTRRSDSVEDPEDSAPNLTEPLTPSDDLESPSLIRTGDDFWNALEAAGTNGGKLQLATDAEIDLATVSIPRGGRWTIQAEPSNGSKSSRPRIRFRPSLEESRSSNEPLVLFQIAPGASLEVQGVDLVLEEPDAPARRHWAAFGVGPGTELVLHRGTVTVEGGSKSGDSISSAVILVQNGPGAGLGLEASGVNVRITDSLLRSGGDIVDVAPGRRLDLSLKNTLVAAGASLLHGHGAVLGESSEPIKLMVSQVTSRTAGGLIRLESSEGAPDLPLVQAVIRDTILATTPQGDPLCVIEGQEGLESLRDRIRWESHGKVVYHQIETYRRDETAQSGTSPVGFKRLSWEVAVGAHEDDPYHGDAHFTRSWAADRPLWTLIPEDARLDDDAPAPGVGPDLDLIPAPPKSDSDKP